MSESKAAQKMTRTEAGALRSATEAWSCGGGTQSAAIAVLILQGRLPTPDVMIMVDTQREKTATWEYMDAVIQPAFRERGLALHIIPKSRYATVDLFRDDKLLLPAYQQRSDGGWGKLPTFCSNEWKQRVFRRALKREFGITRANAWIGMSVDEMKRVRQSGLGWIQHRFPLIFDVPMTRSECRQAVVDYGWPSPPRSACWMCPNMPKNEWDDMERESPEDYARAMTLQAELREKTGDPTLTLCNPETKTYDDGCQTGFCFV